MCVHLWQIVLLLSMPPRLRGRFCGIRPNRVDLSRRNRGFAANSLCVPSCPMWLVFPRCFFLQKLSSSLVPSGISRTEPPDSLRCLFDSRLPMKSSWVLVALLIAVPLPAACLQTGTPQAALEELATADKPELIERHLPETV